MRRTQARKASSRGRTRGRPGTADARLTAHGAPLVVAIGASAGGLEAIEQFLGGVPDSSGLAFVVVQHLDPTHQGVMPDRVCTRQTSRRT